MPAERRREVCREYNGWKNYQTWALNVHGLIDDREDLDQAAVEAYGEDEDQEHRHRVADAVYAVAGRLREELEELEESVREGLPPVLQDVLGAAMEAVDVDTLARHYVESCAGIPADPAETAPATAGAK
jgi:hypothetical protein